MFGVQELPLPLPCNANTYILKLKKNQRIVVECWSVKVLFGKKERVVRGAINMRIRRRKRAHKIILWLQSCFKFLLRGQMWRKSSGQNYRK